MKTAICAIIKDEHRFLEEWIEWHLGLGFDAIHLFEDKGSKSHEEICEKYSNVYLRRYEDDEQVQELLAWQGNSGRQKKLYEWFMENYKDKYDWVAFIDLDEFITFADGYKLDMLLEEFKPYPAVLLNWKIMGASGHINRPNCGVVEAYTEVGCFSSQDLKWGYKSIVNTSRYKGLVDLHYAEGSVNTHHGTNQYDYYYDKAWLNHYFTKSWEDWCDRIFVRGGTQNGHRTLMEFFEVNPSLEYLKEELLLNISNKIPKGTHYLDKKNHIISGGNIDKIMRLNGTPVINLVGYKCLSTEESLNAAIVKAMNLGFNKGNIDKEKLIHFCWFGGAPLPKLMTKCIESWKKYMPEYTYCLWTEDSFNIESHPFTISAYRNKKWAFVSDYVRMWVIYHYGGIYFDTDVELLRSISDFPKNFFCFEKNGGCVADGLGFGAEKHNTVILEHLREYDEKVFSKDDMCNFVSPVIFTNTLTNLGYSPNPNSIHEWNEFTFFPSEYMCPKGHIDNKLEITENTRAIHHYTYTWR